MALFGGTRSQSAILPRALPSLTFSISSKFPPPITALIPQRACNRVKGWLFAHCRRGLSELGSECNNTHYCARMSRPAAAFSLQSVTERFRRLPCLFIADMGIAHGRADIFVAEQFLDFPQILSHLVEEDRGRGVAQPCAVISLPRALCMPPAAAN